MEMDPDKLRATIAAASTNVVGNKMVLFDALLQWREDLMAAAEDAIERHKFWRADTSAAPGMRQKMVEDSAHTIALCEKRLELVRKAMGELT